MSINRPIATPTHTLEIMENFGLTTKKSLGQNFIVEPSILHKMVQHSAIDPETLVVEIGPGIGALTEVLAQHAKQVYAFEIDQRFIEVLAETLSDYSNVEVIHQDILTVDFASDNYRDLQQAERLVVVANLPYYITTPIIMHLIQSPLNFDQLVMMMQKEVAERLTAKQNTKAYSSLTLAINNYMEAEISFIVPPTVFIPKPNVDSAVLQLNRRPQPLVEVEDPQAFELFVRQAFTQRRKTLWNNYRMTLVKQEAVAVEDLAAIFQAADIEPVRRAESLSLEEFHRLYQAYQQVVGH